MDDTLGTRAGMAQAGMISDTLAALRRAAGGDLELLIVLFAAVTDIRLSGSRGIGIAAGIDTPQPVTPAVIAERACLPQGAVSERLARLMTQGHIRAADKNHIVVTAEGIAFLRQISNDIGTGGDGAASPRV